MRRRNFSALLFAVALGWLAAAQAQQTVLEVIELNYRNADQVIPMLKPLLAPGGTISGMQNRIIVRTTPQNLAELRKVLDVVDAMPRKLLISVRQQSTASGSGSEAEVSGSIGNDRARVTVPGTGSNQGGTVVIRRGDDHVRGRVSQSQSAASDSSVQTLQVLEGNEAFIQVGQSVPVRSQSAQGSETIQYRDAGAGFYVRPRVSGNQVTLSISTRRDSVADPNTGAMNVQHVDTVISGRLGEWLELGGIAQERVQRDSGTVYRRSVSGQDDRRVLLKVDVVQ
ncbi:MAG TPA: secretin N-terminal domain-containing protein [Burkholderiales bacterium]|nr:secretin N-terminal domain-containing protein [Burkholderiales bacterium]